jgi:hypothetical protein
MGLRDPASKVPYQAGIKPAKALRCYRLISKVLPVGSLKKNARSELLIFPFSFAQGLQHPSGFKEIASSSQMQRTARMGRRRARRSRKRDLRIQELKDTSEFLIFSFELCHHKKH